MTHLQTAQQNWAETLEQLRLQMPKATFDTWIKDLQLVAAENNHYTVAAANTYAQDWVQNRLFTPIQRTLRHVTGQPDIGLEFVVAKSIDLPATPPPTLNREEKKAELLRTQARSVILEFNPFEHGYIGHPHYIQRFWGAYLGAAALAVYLYIRSFYKEPRYLKDGSTNPNWTPWASIRSERDGGPYRPVDLALAIHSRQVKNPNTGKICGRWRVCPTFNEEYEKGNIWTSCQCNLRRGEMADASPSEAYPDGRRICHYWDPGIMERLAAEGPLLYERIGDPRKPKTIFYLAQVYQPFPLLAPRQVATLNETTQREHEAYLYAHGINVDDWASEFKNEASLFPLAVSWDGASLIIPA